MHNPPKNSEESKLLEILRNPKDWYPIEGGEDEDDDKNSMKSTWKFLENNDSGKWEGGNGYC